MTLTGDGRDPDEEGDADGRDCAFSAAAGASVAVSPPRGCAPVTGSPSVPSEGTRDDAPLDAPNDAPIDAPVPACAGGVAAGVPLPQPPDPAAVNALTVMCEPPGVPLAVPCT